MSNLVVMRQDVQKDARGVTRATYHMRMTQRLEGWADLHEAWVMIEQHDLRVSHGTWYTSHGVFPSILPNKALAGLKDLAILVDPKEGTISRIWGTDMRDEWTDVSLKDLPLRLHLEGRDLSDSKGDGPYAQVYVYG